MTFDSKFKNSGSFSQVLQLLKHLKGIVLLSKKDPQAESQVDQTLLGQV